MAHLRGPQSLDRRRILKGTATAGLAGLLDPLPRALARGGNRTART